MIKHDPPNVTVTQQELSPINASGAELVHAPGYYTDGSFDEGICDLTVNHKVLVD